MLLFLRETWETAVDNGSAVGVIFVDFRKAFDTINHDILDYKMIASGISGNLHNWKMNYPTGRKQYVEINGQKSELLIIKIGVPQGSLLWHGICHLCQLFIKFISKRLHSYVRRRYDNLLY